MTFAVRVQIDATGAARTVVPSSGTLQQGDDRAAFDAIRRGLLAPSCGPLPGRLETHQTITASVIRVNVPAVTAPRARAEAAQRPPTGRGTEVLNTVQVLQIRRAQQTAAQTPPW